MLNHSSHKFSWVTQRAKIIQVKLKKAISYKLDCLGLAHPMKSGIKTNVQSFSSQNPITKTVEGHYPHACVAQGHGHIHPLFHLQCSLVGKSQSQNLAWFC